MIPERRPTSPKRRTSAAVGTARWYRYYAGYAPEFVRDVSAQLGLDRNTSLLDPWNGAGTTTDVAHELGIPALGFDVNPTMVVVAKARLLGAALTPSQIPLAEIILDRALSSSSDYDGETDPLAQWFAPGSASTIRGIERAVRQVLTVGTTGNTTAADFTSGLSSVAAFFYLALFRTVRSFLTSFQPTNPTWIKRPRNARNRVKPSSKAVAERFLAHVDEMASTPRDIPTLAHDDESLYPVITIGVADSKALPLVSGSIDAVISSPPYCTRIDYAVATAPELAVLAVGREDFKSLRRSIIGSALTDPEELEPGVGWGPTCASFLERVASHPSKASATYYLRHHLQYFDSIYQSLGELSRVLKDKAQCVLVVQDSYYKNVHNDLPQIYLEMTDSVGWSLVGRHDFPADSLMARMHPMASRYRRSSEATEAVMWFKTG